MIGENIREQVSNTIRRYLCDELKGKYFKNVNSCAVMHILNIMWHDNYLPRFTKEDISLSCFLFKIIECAYNAQYPTGTYVIEKWITMPEIYSCGWQEISNDQYMEISDKARNFLNKEYKNLEDMWNKTREDYKKKFQDFEKIDKNLE